MLIHHTSENLLYSSMFCFENLLHCSKHYLMLIVNLIIMIFINITQQRPTHLVPISILSNSVIEYPPLVQEYSTPLQKPPLQALIVKQINS